LDNLVRFFVEGKSKLARFFQMNSSRGRKNVNRKSGLKIPRAYAEARDSGVALKDAVRLLGDLTQAVLEKEPLLFHLLSLAVPGNPNGLSPDISDPAEGDGNDEMVPVVEDPFPRGAVGQGKNRTPGQAGQLDHPHLDYMLGPLGAVGSDGQIASLPVIAVHSPQCGKTPARGRTADRVDAQKFYRPGDEFSIPVLADEHPRFSPTGKKGHHEESLMPEGPDDRLALIPGFLKTFRMQRFFPDGQRKQAKGQRAE